MSAKLDNSKVSLLNLLNSVSWKYQQVHKVHKVQQGPAGQINFTNTYLVVGPGATITNENATRAFSVASCDDGDIVLEGGGSVANFLDEGLGNVFQIFRETVNEGNGYQVGGVGTNLTSFDSNAICIDNPPLRP